MAKAKKAKARVAVDPQVKLKKELQRLVEKMARHTVEIAELGAKRAKAIAVIQDKYDRASNRKGEVEAEIAALVAKLVAPVV